MKVAEIIRSILDILDSQESTTTVSDQPVGYSDNDIKRFRQIVDLADSPQTGYSNEPNEQYADLDSVTNDAGADGWQGTKDPADIRGEHPSLYPGKVYGAR